MLGEIGAQGSEVTASSFLVEEVELPSAFSTAPTCLLSTHMVMIAHNPQIIRYWITHSAASSIAYCFICIDLSNLLH